MAGTAISAVVGGVLALLVGFGLTSVVGAPPEPVTAPYVTYGTS